MTRIFFNNAAGFNMPPYWLLNKEYTQGMHRADLIRDDVRVQEMGDKADVAGLLYVPFFDKIEIKLIDEADSEYWPLPLEPVISVAGKNTLIRRHVLKVDNRDGNRRGSVKELWSQDDYEVNIAGLIMGQEGFPDKDLEKLRTYMEARKSIDIKSTLLSVFGIRQLAIEDYSFPFTKGPENQMYTIKAYSDDMFDLLIEEN